jgi:hypothetical protein
LWTRVDEGDCSDESESESDGSVEENIMTNTFKSGVFACILASYIMRFVCHMVVPFGLSKGPV